MASSLHSFVGQTLTWIPTDISMLTTRYALIAPDRTTLATYVDGREALKTKALVIAHVPEGTLFLRKESRSSLNLVLSLGEHGPILATFHRKWWAMQRGHLVFADGRTFQWDKTSFWGSQKTWTDPTSKTASVHVSKKLTATLYPPAAAIPELSFLLVLGCSEMLRERRDV